MIISLIAAMDNNFLIGSKNAMPWHLPADFKHFKEVTLGKPIIMGRKTFESIGRPLPGRLNIVVSRHGFSAEGISSASSVEKAFQLAGDAEEVMIIGGANFYQQMIDKADRLYLTHVDASCDGDVWFPKFDNADWLATEVNKIEKNEKNNYDCRMVNYIRK